MLSAPAGDLTGNLGSCRRWKGTTTPAQSQLSRTRQAELVICAKAIERTFCRVKDCRRIATRYDKLARNYASALALAAVSAFWC
jgi:transposase